MLFGIGTSHQGRRSNVQRILAIWLMESKILSARPLHESLMDNGIQNAYMGFLAPRICLVEENLSIIFIETQLFIQILS